MSFIRSFTQLERRPSLNIFFTFTTNFSDYCSVNIDFIDIDSKTYKMSVNTLIEKLEKIQKEIPLGRIVYKSEYHRVLQFYAQNHTDI
jgi:hypothetical protein